MFPPLFTERRFSERVTRKAGRGCSQVTPQTLVEILDAAHQTQYVLHPLENRGGMFLVGPPEAVKTSLIKAAMNVHSDVITVSDITVKQLFKLREDMSRGRYTTLAFTEFSKIYERHSSVSSNLEGHFRGLVEEGSNLASYSDQRMAISQARCLIVGAMTENFYQNKFTDWIETGFARRFLWCIYKVENSWKLTHAIAQMQPIDLDGIKRLPFRPSLKIKYDLQDGDERQIKAWLKDQPGEATPFLLMSKIVCVLRHKYKKEPGKAKEIIEAFVPCLSKTGGVLIL